MLIAGDRHSFGNAVSGFVALPKKLVRFSAVCLTLMLFAVTADASVEEGFSDRVLSQSAVAGAGHEAVALRARQRELYQQAITAMAQGESEKLRSLKGQLRDYPLYVYLEYEELRRKVNPDSTAQVHTFLGRYPDSPLSLHLRDQWLKTLAKEGRWKDFLADFSPDIRNSTTRCHHGWALYQTGRQEEAFDTVPEIWLTGQSLPDACDPLLNAWRKHQGIPAELVRQRIELAVKAGNWSLATYLARDLPQEQRELMGLYRKVNQQPSLLKQTDLFRKDSGFMRQIVLHGLQRLIRQDTETAADLWKSYQRLHDFSPEERAGVSQTLALYLATSFHPDSGTWLARALKDGEDSALHEWRVRVALRAGDWKEVESVIEEMPEDLRSTPRWQYWLARALESRGGGKRTARAHEIYEGIARERDYYGFLAADRIGVEYSLNHRPLPVNPEQMELVARRPGMQRAQELYLLGMLPEARREWGYVTRNLPVDELLAAANLVQQWGWYSQSMRGAIAAREWDDLQVRFPLVYQDTFAAHAQNYDLDMNWVLALARQESAFMPDARSSKGALGLLQLLPTTAKQTARNIGVGFSNSYQLLDPETNIRLGTAHLNELLERFGNNRILATAAYNAGAGKVHQWLQNGGDQLSYDVWIETLPYYETRGYVQNVLAYSVIYGYRRGKNPRLLVDHEVACVCLR